MNFDLPYQIFLQAIANMALASFIPTLFIKSFSMQKICLIKDFVLYDIQ